jgi:CRP-like cAMP-binding protein
MDVMLLDELRARLAQLSLVKNIPAVMRPRLVMALLGIGQEGKAHKGFVLFREGDPHDDTAYILLEGAVNVDKTDAPAVEVGSPHLLGEMVQFNPQKQRSATVTAATDVRLLRFTWNGFTSAAEEIFTPEEVQYLKQGLEDVAWGHLAE